MQRRMVQRKSGRTAAAELRGEGIRGTVTFQTVPEGVLVRADIYGLPKGEGACGGKFFGFHIHEGERCAGDEADPYADAKGHYNPKGCKHPEHSGDLPPLLGCGGRAYSVVLTDRFTVEEIIGRVVIIHSRPDDFTSQPSGNAGKKIACGEIRER